MNTSQQNNVDTMGSSYENVAIYLMRQSSRTYINIKVFHCNSLVINNNGIWYTGNYKTMQWQNSWGSIYGPYNETNYSIDGGYCYSSTAGQENNLAGMSYLGQTPTVGTVYPATFVGMQAIPQYTYLEFDNSFIENTAYNGNLFTYYFRGNLYSQNQLKLGKIIPNDSYYYECRLYDYSQNIYIGTSFISLNVNPPIFYNDGALYINDNQEVFVNTIHLDYSTQYRLDIVSYYGDGGSNLYEDDEWFIFLPLNSSVSGDIILNVGSGDFTNQDSSMQLINSITEFTPFTNSGDIINNIDIVPIYTYSSGDSIANFFVDILQNISEVFLLDDEVTLHLVLPIFSDEINIRSDFWITHDYLPQLAEFINGAWWFIICLGMLYKIDVLVELYNFGDFITASYYIYQTRRLL